MSHSTFIAHRTGFSFIQRVSIDWPINRSTFRLSKKEKSQPHVVRSCVHSMQMRLLKIDNVQNLPPPPPEAIVGVITAGHLGAESRVQSIRAVKSRTPLPRQPRDPATAAR